MYFFFFHIYITLLTLPINRCTCTFREHAQKKILEPDSLQKCNLIIALR